MRVRKPAVPTPGGRRDPARLYALGVDFGAPRGERSCSCSPASSQVDLLDVFDLLNVEQIDVLEQVDLLKSPAGHLPLATMAASTRSSGMSTSSFTSARARAKAWAQMGKGAPC